MKNQKAVIKNVQAGSILGSNLSDGTTHSSKLSSQLLSYYKDKSEKLEKGFDDLAKILNKVKSTCDFSNELQRELNFRNEEVSKLQKIIGDLQLHLFKEKEENLKLSAENDQLKVEDYTNKKKINLLLMANGTCEKKYLHLVTNATSDKFVPTKLPPKLQKLKEAKQRQMIETKSSEDDNSSTSGKNMDPQVLLLKNQLLASQLEYHIKISREQIDMLIKEKEVSDEERKVEQQRLQKVVELTSSKLKESQGLLCETTEKLLKCQQIFEKEKSFWLEEKDKYLHSIFVLKEKLGEDISDLMNYCLSETGSLKHRFFCEKAESKNEALEKQQIAAAYREQILSLEAEVNSLRERAQICRSAFKDKTEKMTAQVNYLKNKYEDLDRRRQLEAEGFRTDIRMLRDRLKELEKKLTKSSGSLQSAEQQQLLVSARNTLNRAKQLEKELAFMKSKILTLECYGESDSRF